MTVSHAEFRRLLADPDVPEHALRALMRPDPARGGPFAPCLVPDPDRVAVEPDALEGALDIANAVCRRRRHRAFERRTAAGDTAPVLVAEGDSWFQFPFLLDDVVDHLSRDYRVWCVGAAGDTARGMVFDRPEFMAALDRHAGDVRAFLFSAAGNDVIGADAAGRPMLARLLRPGSAGSTAEALVDRAALDVQLAGIRAAYARVVATVRADPRFAALPILIHGYDHCHPGTPDDARRAVYAAPDLWLGRAFAERGIDDPSLRRAVVRLLIDALYDTLAALAADDAAGAVHVVDLRGTLPDVTDWADEIHPTDAGFARVADRFRTVLARAVAPATAPSPVPGLPDPGRFLAGWRARLFGAAGLEKLIGADDTLPAAFLAEGADRARAVCKVEVSGRAPDGTPASWSGTGFLVGENLLMTNNHVLPDAAAARGALLHFGYETAADGTLLSARTFRADPDRLFLTSPAAGGLDYTVVHVEGASAVLGTIAMDRGAFTLAPGERANVLHHPRGRPKRVSLRANQSLRFDPMLVHYVSDTEPGSSGAPVFDDAWRLVALHHACQALPPGTTGPDGRPAAFANEGIRLSAIVADLETRLAVPTEAAAARRVLAAVTGSDSMAGYFGTGTRHAEAAATPFDRVAQVLAGAGQDVDIGHWRVEGLASAPEAHLGEIAAALADLNADVWALAGCDAAGAARVAARLAADFGLGLATHAHEGPGGAVAVLWNPALLAGGPEPWPGATPPDAPLVHLTATARAGLAPYALRLVPLAGPVATEGLAAALAAVGGDCVVTGTADAAALAAALGHDARAAQDPAAGGAVVAAAPGSLVQAVTVAPAMAPVGDAPVGVAGDAAGPERLRALSGHRPLLLRLSLADTAAPPAPPEPEGGTAALARDILALLAAHGLDGAGVRP